MPINAKLVVVGGEVKTAEIKLRLPCTIGRGRGCTIMLPQALVSRQHCELSESGGQVIVRDLGSLNGTFINNQKISAPAAVRSEELLTIGTVTFRVVYDAADAAGPPSGPVPVMKSAAASAGPAPAGDDASQPLEIGDFEFEETVRTSDTDVPGDEKFPGVVPAFQTGASPAPTPAAAKAAGAAQPVPLAAAPVPAAKPLAAPPAAKPASPPAKPAPAPAPAAAEKGEEVKEEEEDDFQDFLKSLGK